jgi:hypothetical protein
VDAVYVKSGKGGSNLYVYDPPSESTGDTGLTTPGSEQNISHISFCYDGGGAPSPSPSPSVENRVETKKPQVLGVTLTRALPATGSNFPELPLTGLALVTMGLLMVGVARVASRRVLAEQRRIAIGDWGARIERYLSR